MGNNVEGAFREILSGWTPSLVNGAFAWVSGNHRGCQMGWLKVVSERVDVDTYFLGIGAF